MGFGGISVWQLVIVAVIIALLFGTKKLRSVGSDLGSAVKGFKKAVVDEESKKEPEQIDETASVAQKVEQTELSDDKQKS